MGRTMSVDYEYFLVFLIINFSVTCFFAVSYFAGRRRRVGVLRSERLREATVARQLVPRFDPFVSSGDCLYVFGSDGLYISSPGGGVWRDALVRWLDRGCSVRYFLTVSKGYGVDALLNISAENGRKVDAFYVPDRVDGDATELHRLALEGCLHPTVLVSANGSPKALWIEHFHKAGSHIARDIDYTSWEDIASSSSALSVVGFFQALHSRSVSVRDDRLRVTDRNRSELVAAT